MEDVIFNEKLEVNLSHTFWSVPVEEKYSITFLLYDMVQMHQSTVSPLLQDN